MKKFEIWLANLNPSRGTEPGKIRPVVIIQTDFLNSINHSSTLICSITSNLSPQENVLRVKLKKGVGKLVNDCEILVDQIRAIDNVRFIECIGVLTSDKQKELQKKIVSVVS